jgi:hypothetical protein
MVLILDKQFDIRLHMGIIGPVVATNFGRNQFLDMNENQLISFLDLTTEDSVVKS